jgi:LPS-assembly protein
MNARTRFLITAALVCHLLAAPALVTSQALSPPAKSETPQAKPDAPSTVQYQDVTWIANAQEKEGSTYKLHGQAEIHYGGYILRADEITYEQDKGEATADGHVILDGGPNDEHLQATHATYNLPAEAGKFDNVRGTIGLRMRDGHLSLTSANPFVLSGKVVEKLGPDHYRVSDGTVTSCQLPRPKWDFYAHRVVVDTGGNATLYSSAFRILRVPILFFPFATHPVNREARESGFLMPNFGRSSIKGNILGESVYWAINRSMDLTAGAEYFSLRGWAPQGEFRARPSEASFVDLTYFAVLDRGYGPQSIDQGGGEVRLDAEGSFDHNFRAVADIDYLSTYVFRLAFYDVFTQAVNSEVKSDAFLTNSWNGFFYNGFAERYQNFESDTVSSDIIKILHAPSFEFSSVDRPLGRTPLHWSLDATAGGLSRSEPTFRTATLVGRFDLSPSLSVPLLWAGWSFRPELSLRETLYTQELTPSSGVGVAADTSVSRKALEGSVEVRPPALGRIFQRELLGRRWKHVIEPRVTYRYVTGVDNFSNILRFDERDILSDTSEVEYAMVNRLYAKRTSGKSDCGSAGMPALAVGGTSLQPRHFPWEKTGPTEASCTEGPRVREVVTWELAQKYFLDPTFGGALAPGVRNVFTTTADLTGIAFLTDARHLSPLVSRLRFQTSARTDAEWDLDYDFRGGRISSSTALVNYRFGPFTLGGGDAFLQTPGAMTSPTPVSAPQKFSQFRVLLGYGHTNKPGFSGAANIGFDANLGSLQYASIQTAYNWDCCGLSVEYRRFALGSVRNENQFRFTFALANVGGFGNLRRQERLF